MPPIREALPVLLYGAAGVTLILVVLARWQLRGRPPLLRGSPMRANRLTWIGVLGCILTYLAVAQFAYALIPVPPSDAGTEATTSTDIVRSVLTNTAAQFTGGLACLTVAAFSFRRGLAGFGLTTRRLPRDLLVGLGLLLAFDPIGAGLLWFANAIMLWLGMEPPDHRFVQFLHDPNTPDAIRPLLWLGPALIAPIAEEVFFRGMLQTVLRRTLRSRLFGVLVAAGIFGFAHYNQPQAVLPLLVFGLFTGIAYERTGSLVGPIAFHAIFNLKNLLLQMMLTPAPPPVTPPSFLNW